MHDPPPGTRDEVLAHLDDPDADPGMSPIVRTLVTVVLSALVLGLLIGGFVVFSRSFADNRTEAGRVGLEGAPQISLRARTADVRLVQGDTDAIEYSARITDGIVATDFELRRRGDEIEVVGRCREWLAPGCGVEITLAVPKGVPVELLGGSGEVVAEGLDGVLTVRAAGGDVRADDLRVDELSVQTTSGDVDATFADQPFAVKATTSSGDVDLTLPDGDRAYVVDARARDGEVRNDLGDEGEATGTQAFVRVLSTSGDVRVGRD